MADLILFALSLLDSPIFWIVVVALFVISGLVDAASDYPPQF